MANLGLSLTRLEAPLRLVNDVDAALAAHEAVVAMAFAQGFQRIADFHWSHHKVFPQGRDPRRMIIEALLCLKPGR